MNSPIEEAVDRFSLSLSISVSPSTKKFYLAGCKTLIDLLPGVGIEDVTRDDLRRWYLSLVESGRKPRTVNGYVKGVKALFKFLVEEELLIKSPAAVLKVREVKSEEPRAISDEDLSLILLAAKDHSPRAYLLVLLLTDTGARIAELAGVLVDDIALEHERNRGAMTVMGKGGKSRSVSFGQQTYRAMSSYLLFRRKRSPALFPNKKGQPITTQNLRMILYQVAESSGAAGPYNPHSFRHRFAREWLRRGGDIKSLSRQLGHASVLITLRYYVRWTSAELDNIHEAIDPVRTNVDRK